MRSVYDLDYSLINSLEPVGYEVSMLEKAFKFWKSSWELTFGSSLKVDKYSKMYSDDFIGKEVSCLSFQGDPVGLFFNHFFDISRDYVLGHSYFKDYPTEIINNYRKDRIKKVMIFTLLTVDKEWRKSETDFPISEILFSLGIQRFKESDVNTLICYIRKDLKTNEMGFRHGGIKTGESHVYNVDVDYFKFNKETCHISQEPGIAEAVEHFWSLGKKLRIAA